MKTISEPAFDVGVIADMEAIERAIKGLQTADWLRLKKAANSFLYGTGFSCPEELLNEVYVRVLSGSRKWPLHIPFVTFLIRAMESVADGDRSLLFRREEVASADLSVHDSDWEDDPIELFGDDKQDPVNQLIAEQKRRQDENDLKMLYDHFENKRNQSALWVLKSIEETWSVPEVLARSGMTMKSYESARKQFLRGLDRLFPGRRK